MAVEALRAPPAALATEKFSKKYHSPERLLRVSSYTTGEPFFGMSGFRKAMQRFAIVLI